MQVFFRCRYLTVAMFIYTIVNLFFVTHVAASFTNLSMTRYDLLLCILLKWSNPLHNLFYLPFQICRVASNQGNVRIILSKSGKCQGLLELIRRCLGTMVGNICDNKILSTLYNLQSLGKFMKTKKSMTTNG